MAILIDRTSESELAAESRKRFIQRTRDYLRRSVIQGSNQTKTPGLSHGAILVSDESIIEPYFTFFYDTFKEKETVILNEAFNKGDLIFTPYNDQMGKGGKRGENGDGDNDMEDSFSFLLSEQEFINLIFENLELPNFIEKDSPVINYKKWKHAGFVKYGLPSNLNIMKSFKESFGRRIASNGALKEQIQALEDDIDKNGTSEEKENLLKELKDKIKNIPYFDEEDLRYNTRVPCIEKISKAVVFLMLDVSGSMTMQMKDLAKRFFYMMSLFLKTKYKETEIVFITHTDTAIEVDQNEFFYSRRTGSTEFLPAYQLVNEIIETRYPVSQYNIYLAHASDSEMMDSMEKYREYLTSTIIPKIQYGVYTHIGFYMTDFNLSEKAIQRYALAAKEMIDGLNNDKFKFGLLDDSSDPYRLLLDLFGKKRGRV